MIDQLSGIEDDPDASYYSMEEKLRFAIEENSGRDFLDCLTVILQEIKSIKIYKAQMYIHDNLDRYKKGIKKYNYLVNRDILMNKNRKRIADELNKLNPRSKKQLKQFKKEFCEKELGIGPRYEGQGFPSFICDIFKSSGIDSDLEPEQFRQINKTCFGKKLYWEVEQ